ncbi:MAG: UbiA family prenyltransferase [Candidatus Neomarinimicrobiota bacterium]
MRVKFRAFLDLTRAHFVPVWPLLFTAGYLLAVENYGQFSWTALIHVALIGLFGFEAGMILNDVIDHKIDERDVEFDKLTKYWRPFGQRPIPAGLISFKTAVFIDALFFLTTFILIMALPRPNRWYVLAMMPVCYSLESFYNLKKRRERLPLAQLIGRIDFALFPVVGYLTVGVWDIRATLFFLFFYPLALAHLGVNDLVDIVNDRERKVNTVTTMYGIDGTIKWIGVATAVHLIMAIVFASSLGAIVRYGFLIGFALISIANGLIITEKTPASALKALPLVHAAMLVYIVSIILDVAF